MLVPPESPPAQACKGRYLWLYLFALAAAEWVTADVGSALGLRLHTALFILLLVRVYATVGSESNAHVALSLLPLLRVISLTVPSQLVTPTDQLGLVSALFLLSLLFAARALRYGAARALGLNFRLLILQLLTALLGPLLIYTLAPLPALADGLQLEGLIHPAASLFTAGVVEEIFSWPAAHSLDAVFRGLAGGYPRRVSLRWLSPLVAGVEPRRSNALAGASLWLAGCSHKVGCRGGACSRARQRGPVYRFAEWVTLKRPLLEWPALI